MKTPREETLISLLNSYLDLDFKVFSKADNSRYGDGNDIRLVNLGRIALYINLKLTTSSGKHLKETSHAHIFSLMFEMITSAK